MDEAWTTLLRKLSGEERLLISLKMTEEADEQRNAVLDEIEQRLDSVTRVGEPYNNDLVGYDTDEIHHIIEDIRKGEDDIAYDPEGNTWTG